MVKCSGENLTLVGWRHMSKYSQTSATSETLPKLLFTPKTLPPQWLWCSQSSRSFPFRRFQLCHLITMTTDHPWFTPIVIGLIFPRMHITCHALQSRQLYTEAISLHAIQIVKIVSVSNHDSYNQSAHANRVVTKISPVTSSNTYKPPFSNEIERRGKKRIRTRQTGPWRNPSFLT